MRVRFLLCVFLWSLMAGGMFAKVLIGCAYT